MRMDAPKPVIVIGLGNPLMADEGVGTSVVGALAGLAEAGKLPADNVEYLDGGCGGLYLLHSIEGRKKAILIDCAKMGLTPGTLRRFTPSDVATVKQMMHLSLHEVDILRVIELATLLNQCPDEIIIFGVEPEKIEMQIGLTETLQQRVPEYLAAVVREIENDTPEKERG